MPTLLENTADLLDGLELFAGFGFGELKTFAGYVTQRRFQPKETIFNEGDAGDFMLILADGRLSIFKGGEHGTHLLAYEGRGRIVGEMALLDRERRSATCIAETSCTILSIDVGQLDGLAQEHPMLAYKFMHSLARLLSRRLRKTSGMLVEYLGG